MSIPMSNRDRQNGSALIVVAVLLIFAGFVLTLGLGPFHTTDNQDKIQRTAKRQQFLIHELSTYVQRENALPCPADPSLNPLTNIGFGYSINTIAPNAWKNDQNNPGVCDVNTAEGIIPFRTLGIAQYDALDGWGRPFTYRISPVYNNPPPGNIFMRCRRFPWFYDYTNGPVIPYDNTHNVNPAKALFCCPPDNYNPNTDVAVYVTTGGALVGPYQRTVDAVNDDLVDKMVTTGANAPLTALPVVNTTVETQEGFAFVIVSHGANGLGSYVLGTNGQYGTPVAGSDEATNANQGTNFVDHPMILAPGAYYFDDMVVWRTQIGIMGELNNGSCYAPFN